MSGLAPGPAPHRQAMVEKTSSLDSIINAAARKNGIEPWLLRAVGEQETGLGSSAVYDASTGLSRTKGNQGHGIWQLDPASGASSADLARAAKDPAFAADYAARMLRRNLDSANGNYVAALSAYNAGSASSRQGLAYAQQVLARVPNYRSRHGGLELTADLVPGPAPQGLTPGPAPKQGGLVPGPPPSAKPTPTPTVARTQAAAPAATPLPSLSGASNPMDAPSQPANTIGAGGMVSPSGHTTMEELGGATQILPVIGTGMTESRLAGHGEFGPEFKQAIGTYAKDPAQAADLYGYQAAPADAFARAHAAPGSLEQRSADFDKNHPTGAAFLTLGEMLADPVQRGVGKAMEPIVNPAFHAVTDFLSPFRGIAQAAGHKGAAAVRAWLSRMKAPVGDVEQEVENIFGGLTKDEKLDVLRRSEPAGKGKVTDSQHDLDARAKAYRTLLKKVDAAQKSQPGLLEDNRTFNSDLFHPLSGAFQNPEYDSETNDVLDQLRSLQGGGGGVNVRKGTAAANGPSKSLSRNGIEPVLRSGLLRDDYDPAASTRRHVTRALQNVEFEKGVRSLPKTLRRDYQASDYVNGMGKVLDQPWARSANETPAETLQKFIEENHAKFPPGNPMRYEFRPQDGMIPAHETLRNIGSPALKNSLIHPEFDKFLRSRGGSMLSGEPTKSMAVTLPGHLVGLPNAPKVTLPIGEVLDKYNSAFRSAVIANALFHPVWNLRENMAAAGDMPIAAIRQTLKTIVGAVSEKGHDWFDHVDSKLFHQASQKSDEYAEAVKQAIHDGATAEMHPTRSVFGQDIATVRTTPNSEKTLGQKFDTALTSMRDWNTRKTFGRTGEQGYAVSLYQRLKKIFPHASGEEIGNMVRDSLGAYQNVDPNNPMARLFFFYPWLKGNTLNWMRNLLTRPGYTTSPLEAMRRYNQQTGDPNLTGTYPTKDYQQYAGGQNYFTYPLPQRVAGDIVNAVGSGDPSNMLYEGANILRSHATPAVGNILDAFSTKAAQAGSPSMPSNYDKLFDKNAPTPEKWKQAASYFLSHDVPIPLVGYAVQDAVRRGYSPEQFVDTLKQAAGMGYPSQKLTEQQTVMASRFRKAYDRQFYAAKQSGNTQQLIQAYQQYMHELRALGIIR